MQSIDILFNTIEMQIQGVAEDQLPFWNSIKDEAFNLTEQEIVDFDLSSAGKMFVYLVERNQAKTSNQKLSTRQELIMQYVGEDYAGTGYGY